jgi:rhamnosyltransferase subunit B
MSRVLFATLGSLGDLHPLIAIALEMRNRGQEARFCTSETYRKKIEGLGFRFDPLRPDATPENEEMAELVRQIMDPVRGAERLLRGVVLPRLRETYDDLKRAVTGPPKVDLLLYGELVYPAPLLAEQYGLCSATCILAPMSFFSAYDPPVLPPFPRLAGVFRRLGPSFNRRAIGVVKSFTRNWSKPVRALRAELELPPAPDPIYEGKFSPDLVLGLFSPVLATPQPDWPRNTVITGFTFYDGPPTENALPPGLIDFLQNGETSNREAPIVFTLGSSAVLNPGSFYEVSVEAASLLKHRAVLLMGPNPPPPGLPPGVMALGYVRFSEIFPYAAAVVHQGGIGTTGQAMRAGRPMLVMPFNFDQPDNAARSARLGVGRVIDRGRYSARRVAQELSLLLQEPYQTRAKQIGKTVAQEHGAQVAADALEQLLNRRGNAGSDD